MNRSKSMPPQKPRRFTFLFFVLLLVIVSMYIFFGLPNENQVKVSYTQFIEAVINNQVDRIEIVDERQIYGEYKASVKNRSFKTIIPYNDTTLIPLLEQYGVSVTGRISTPSVLDYALNFLPWILMFVFFMLIMRQNMQQSSRGMQFGKSRARQYDSTAKKVTFSDVAGHEEPKRELAEVVDFLKNPTKYVAIGAKIPTGVLLVGNPGTGKTLLARAVAGEAGVNFLHISGSDFVEMFVGVGASRVRDLFEQGRKLSPCIIFIDEIDAVGRARGAGFGGGHDEREQTLNQLLVEMDGFETKDSIIILAATNRPDVLDPALLRPGRFDRQVVVPLPDVREREAILKIHAKKIKLNMEVDLNHLAKATPGLSGSDLANMINESALFAARKEKEQVDFDDLEDARDKQFMGIERKSLVISEKEKKLTAYHEAGHTLPYYFLKNVSALHKVTIIPRGRALGVTWGLPDEDVVHCATRSMLLDKLVVMFGGYAAETIVFNDTTTGTQNDIMQATELAHKMVCDWGMSDLGAVSYGQEDAPIFMGKEIARHKDYSEFTAKNIDVAVKTILSEAKEKAIAILKEHREKLDMLSSALLEKETMSDSEIRTLLNLPAVSKA
ncbi:MAG: ATP-dependent zinc metalloprotease FtsH [Treponemataceae bacterium]